MFAPRLFGYVMVAIALPTLAAAQGGDEAEKPVPEVTSLPPIPREIHQAMQSRSFQGAVDAIDKVIADDGGEHKDYLLYLKGVALTELKQLDEALEVFAALEKEYPDSVWRSRAKFGRANVLVIRRQYIGAGKIYREEAERLLSRERKDELAGIYLEFADKYYDGVPADDPSRAKKPDYKQALTYYQEAVKLKPTAELLQRIEFRIARCHEETGDGGQAISAYQKFLKDYARVEPESGYSASIDIEAEARYRLGAVELKAGQPVKARRTWQDFLASAGALDDDPSPKLREFLAKAEYRLAHTYGLPKPRSIGDLELGVAAAQRFLNRNPNHQLAALAELEIAQGFSHHRRFQSAAEKLQSLIENPKYADSEQIPVARRMLGQAFLAGLQFDEAIAAWNEFLDEHPTDPQWPGVQKWVVDAEYSKADHARNEKRFDEARQLWQTFLNKYPLDARAPAILYRFGMMKYNAAVETHLDRIKEALDRGDSPQTIQVNDECQKLFQEAIGDWRRLVSKYPQSGESSQASFMIGVTLEDRLGELSEALDAYKKVKGNREAEAKKRIVRLTTPQLEIVTERKFRSDEKPRIKLTTRNLEEVSVKAYRVDMTDYFRKMHLASGIETLDIALIDPDSQFDHSVKDYAQYRRIDSDVEIPVDGVGVTAVTVSSEKLEVTTMVVVSDLDVVVKTSRNELFLFAEDMRTGKPVDGASVLISDGSHVFAEELTNQDGVLQKSFDELKSVSDLRVFAVHQGNVASTINSLNGLDFAVGLTPRGYLYTDRPAYRAGQLVNIKGIIRWVDQDRFTFSEGERFKLDVYDSRGRQIQSTEVALNGYGTISSNLILPDTSPQGDYRVHLHRTSTGAEDSTGELSFETRFHVTEYRLEPIEVSIDLEKEVYFRGDKVKGSVSVKYYYGTPLTGEKLTYTFGPDGETVTATTDDEGKVKLSFDTQRFSESQPLKLVVQYPDRGISSSKTVYLATRGFAIGVESARDVYISGETFDATFKVTDPAGNPVMTDLKVEVFEQTRVAGKPGEKLVQTHELTTDKESGQASKTLAIESGGMYLVRATGKDQFDNQVSGQRRIRISGDKDNVRLRILAEKHAYNVGEIADIRLHWREQPALGLVTFEGASVLGYQLVDLKTGDNTIRVPIDAQLAPNFFLSVAVMQRNRFHTAASGFRVAQRLNIVLKPERTTLQPGDALKVNVEVTDPQGNPVQSEISLALVQTNLLSLFSDVQGAVDAFFGTDQRRPSVRQMTSCTFRYRPSTRAVSQFLLAEAERRSRLEREVRTLAEAIPDVEANAVADLDSIIVRGARSDVEQVMQSMQQLQSQVDFGSGQANGAHIIMSDGAVVAQPEPYYLQDDVQYFPSVPGFQSRLGDIDGDTAGAVMAGEIAGIVANDLFDTGGQMGGGLNLPQVAQQRERLTPAQGRNTWSLRQSLGRGTNRGQAAVHNMWGAINAGQSIESFGDLLPRQNRQQVQVYYEQLNLPGPGVGGPGPGVVSFREVSQLLQSGQNDLTVNGLTKKGQLLVVNGRGEAELEKLVNEDGLQLLPGMAHAETAFWDPTIVTDEAGKAEVVITMPTRSTAWRLRVKGVDVTSLAGEASAEVLTKKELFGDMKLPLAFTAGDKAEIPVDVHNSLDGAREIQVLLDVTLGDKTTTQRKTIDVEGPGVSRVSFPIEIESADSAQFQLTVTGGDQNRDQNSRVVKVVPYGYPVYETASGTSSQSTIALIAFDETLKVENPSLEILIGSSVNRSLIESVLGGGLFPAERCGLLPSSGLERSVSDVLGGVALMKMIGAAQQDDTPEAQALAARITAAISQLISAQRDDGAWSWSGRPDSGDADVYLSARVMWTLSEARSSGFAVAGGAFDKGKASLKKAFASTSQVDLERQTILLHAMAESKCADFALANRLYRERNRLSNSAVIHLALALAAMNHDEMAAELLPLVKMKIDPATAAKRSSQRASGVIPWMQSGIEMRAMYLLALERIESSGATMAKLADWLAAARVGSRWPVEKANGPAIAALAHWYAKAKHVSEKYTMTLWVNDNELDTVTIDPSKDGSRRFPVPSELLEPGKRQRIHFDVQGRGTFSYSAILTGFVPAARLQSTAENWTVARRYEPAQRLFDGRPVPRGFGVVNGPYKSFYNPLTELPVGDRGEVTLSPRRRNTTGRPGEQYDYLVLTEPIPAGCTVLDGSVQGSFERFEIEPGRITFYIGARRYPGDIRYTLLGYVPGTYRSAQSLLRSFYDPSQMAIADTKELKVVPGGSETVDEYRLTPDELYHLGQKELQKKNFQAAHDHLTELLDKWRLDTEPYKNSVRWVFRTALEKSSHGEIVKYFEIIKEKYPDVELSFADILQVALSYRELAEYERSYLVYRSTVQASFERESQVAGFLNARGEFVRSVAAMERLLRDYPAESYVAIATYALAQEVYRRAPAAEDDKKLRDAGLNRVHLINGSIEMLDHFVSTWPLDPADDQASFALATALIDLDQYESAIVRCQEYAKRYPDSRLLDSFWYMIGYSHFELEHHEQALEMCEKVASASFDVPETGGTRAADNKWEAIYIMGQVYHSLGKAADAIMQYAKVKQRFADAAEAIEYFSRKEIRLDEVTTIKPNDSKELTLDYRNIADVAIKVYRIDLMKFGLMQRNLDRITAINLAGIKPYHEETVKLGDGKDYRDREKKLTLPLKEEGAYLVVCRGENLYASGLVLVSPLTLSVAEDVDSGRVRVSVKDATKDSFVNEVHVKVIGSANEQFESGATDLRGLFVADDIKGTSTVIAQVKEDQYAFYRGELALQGFRPEVQQVREELEQTMEAEPQEEAQSPSKAGKDLLRGNIFDTNGKFQIEQKGNYDGLLNNDRDGVAPSEAY